MLKRGLFCMLVIFAFFFGNYLFAQVPADTQKELKPQTTDKIQAKVDELAKELDLTAEQQVKIKEVLQKSTEEIRGILQATKDKAKEIKVKAHDEIMNLLTQEQRDEFKVTRKKHEVVPKVEE